MKHFHRYLSSGLLSVLTATLPLSAAEPSEVLLDPCDNAAAWQINPGREFPGAQGKLEAGTSDGRTCIRVDYDFTKGGNYFGADRAAEIPQASELAFFIKTSSFRGGMIRLRDATDQEFLGNFKVTGSDWQQVRIPISAEGFGKSWGGAKDGKFHFPLKRLLIAARAPGAGSFLLRDLTIATADTSLRWQLTFTTALPGNIAFTDDAPAIGIITARNCTSESVPTELRYRVNADDGRKVLAKTLSLKFQKWEQRRIEFKLPTRTPGYYRSGIEIVSGTNNLATTEGGIGVVVRPVNFGKDDERSFFGLHVSDPAAAERPGVKWTRVFRQWWWVESLKGRYWWPDEKTVDAARTNHMRVMITFDADLPGWLKKELPADKPMWPFPDQALRAYENFIRAGVQHYRDNVEVFEIQNEPDLSCWRHNNQTFADGVESYVRMAKAAAPIIRQEAPRARIAGVDVSGGDFDYGLQYSRSVFRQVGGLFDIYTGHPYASPRYFGEGLRPLSPDENRQTEKLQDVQRMIGEFGGKQKAWIGELGWGLDVKAPLAGAESLACASCVARSLIEAHSVSGLERYFYFLQQGANERGFEYGLWRGSPSQPLPAAVAYATAARLLHHAQPQRTLNLPKNLRGYTFACSDLDRGVVVLWTLDEESALKARWPRGTRACNLMGRETSLSPLAITGAPVFVTTSLKQLDALCAAIEKQPPAPTLPVRVESIYLTSTNQIAARVINRLPRPMSLSMRVRDLASTEQSAAANQQSTVVFDLSGSVTSLGWKTVSADVLEKDRVVATKPLQLNLRPCPRRTIKLGAPLTALGKPSTSVSTRWQVLPPDPNVGWDGPEDLSAEAWWSYDDENFYFTARVKDDLHCTPSTDLDNFQNSDSLLLAFDTANDATESGGYDANDVELGCVVTPKGPRVFMTYPERKPIEIPAIGKREGKETIYQLAIPWKLLGMKPVQGKMFSFNFALNDNDGNGRAYWMGPKPGIVEAKRPFLFMRMWLGK